MLHVKITLLDPSIKMEIIIKEISRRLACKVQVQEQCLQSIHVLETVCVELCLICCGESQGVGMHCLCWTLQSWSHSSQLSPLHCVTCKRKEADIESGQFFNISLLTKCSYFDFEVFSDHFFPLSIIKA